MADDPQTAANGGGFLDNFFSFGDGLFKRWMDYERFDAETDLARAAAGQNLAARQNSIDAQKAGMGSTQILVLAGVAVLAIILLKKL